MCLIGFFVVNVKVGLQPLTHGRSGESCLSTDQKKISLMSSIEANQTYENVESGKHRSFGLKEGSGKSWSRTKLGSRLELDVN